MFDKVIANLEKLDEMGYGTEKGLDLVYNPLGGSLPPEQSNLQSDYERKLKKKDVVFSNLFTIANMSIGCFRDFLIKKGRHGDYMKSLEDNYNEEIVENIMCGFQVSVDGSGSFHDCDLRLAEKAPTKVYKNIKDLIDIDDLSKEIVRKDYCYGCAAGSGSSCGGALNE